MAGITLAIAQAHLDAWLAASLAAANNQSYTINERSLTRADAKEIREQIMLWNTLVKQLTAGTAGPRVRLGVPS